MHFDINIIIMLAMRDHSDSFTTRWGKRSCFAMPYCMEVKAFKKMIHDLRKPISSGYSLFKDFDSLTPLEKTNLIQYLKEITMKAEFLSLSSLQKKEMSEYSELFSFLLGIYSRIKDNAKKLETEKNDTKWTSIEADYLFKNLFQLKKLTTYTLNKN